MTKKAENSEFTEIKQDANLDVVEGLRKELDVLKNVDYTKDDLNIEDTFNKVFQIEQLSKKIKEDEVANVTKTLAPKYLDLDAVEDLVNRQNSLESFFDKYKVEEVKATFTEDQKDRLFSIFRFSFIEYQTVLNNMKVNLTFKAEQFKVIDNILRTKTTYGLDELIHGIDLKNTLLDEMYKTFKTEKVSTFKTEIKNVMVMYHLLNKYSIVGISKDTYEFAAVIVMLQEVNECYRKFVTVKERLGQRYESWVSSITDLNTPLKEEAATGNKVEPAAVS